MALPAANSTIEVAELAGIRGPFWPVDPMRVEEFRGAIRNKEPLGTLILRLVWNQDASFVCEILDGFHRFAAMSAEGVTSCNAAIWECTDEMAEVKRIQCSLDKPDEVLHKRAIQAIREAFNRELRAFVEGSSLDERRIDDEGNIIVRPRTDPLPDDPLQILVAIADHVQSRYEVVPNEEWRTRIEAWLEKWSGHFNMTRTHLWDEILMPNWLAIEEIRPAHGSRGHWITASSRWQSLTDIPDPRIRRAIMARLKKERGLTDEQLDDAIRYLGLHIGSQHPRGYTTLMHLLGQHTLTELAAKEVARRDIERGKTLPKKPGDMGLVPDHVRQEVEAATSDPHATLSDEAVFAIISPKYMGSGYYKQNAPTPGPTREAMVRLLTELRRYGEEYESAGGSWRDPGLQAMLKETIDWASARLLSY